MNIKGSKRTLKVLSTTALVGIMLVVGDRKPCLC